MSEIDFVIPWVDGNDSEWRKLLKYYSVNPNLEDARLERYREWEILHFWFRGIEKFAPWVRKIHFITQGHLPAWLNVNHPKINIVRHADYIPKEYLPVFSSHPIELFINRIKDLSEKFVYFNDDVFLINSVSPEDFFQNALPCDVAAMNAIGPKGISHILINDLEIISRNFDKYKVIKNNFKKWFRLGNFSKSMRTLALLPWPDFTGFYDHHSAQPYLRSTLNMVWEKESEILLNTACSRFRTYSDVNAYVFRYWQLCSGDFHPSNRDSIAKFFILNENDISEICEYIINQKRKIITLNDGDIKQFDIIKSKLKCSFNSILPNKSDFEY